MMQLTCNSVGQLSCNTHARTHLRRPLTQVSQQDHQSVTRGGATKTDVVEGLDEETGRLVRHLPASLADYFRAEDALTYRTLCGMLRRPRRANDGRDEYALSAMEKCAVCAWIRGPL